MTTADLVAPLTLLLTLFTSTGCRAKKLHRLTKQSHSLVRHPVLSEQLCFRYVEADWGSKVINYRLHNSCEEKQSKVGKSQGGGKKRCI